MSLATIITHNIYGVLYRCAHARFRTLGIFFFGISYVEKWSTVEILN